MTLGAWHRSCYIHFHTVNQFSETGYGISCHPVLLIITLINVHKPYGRRSPLAVNGYLAA
jgi:hypothetical protein